MLKLFKVAGGVFVAGLLLFAVGLLAAYHLIQSGELRQYLINHFQERTGAKASVGEVDLKFGYLLEATFQDFVLSEPDREIPIMTAERVVMRLALRPLLERRLVFQEIRFSHPLLRLEKDDAGNFPSLRLLSRLLLSQSTEENLELDLQKIEIEKGRALVRDPKQPLASFVLQLRETDLRLQRIASPPSKPFSSAPSYSHSGGNGLALHFALETQIEKDGVRTKLASNGNIYALDENLDFRKARLDAETRIESVPANVLWEYLDFLPAVKRVGGTLATDLRLQGALSEQVRVKGKIDFTGLALDAPGFLTQSVKPGEGQTEFEVEWTPGGVRIPRWDFRSQELAFSAREVSFSRAEDEVRMEGRWETPFLPLTVAQRYLPRQLLESPRWGPRLSGWHQGEFRLVRAEIKGPLSNFEQFVTPGLENRLEFELEIRGAADAPREDGRPSLKDVKGRLVLEQGILYYRDFSGIYGESRLTEINGSQKGVLGGRSLLELRLRGDIALAEWEQPSVRRFFPPRLSKNMDLLKDAEGKGHFKLFFRTDFASLHYYEGELLLDQARLRVGDLYLTRLRGNVSFSPTEARTEQVTAVLSGSPITIQLALKNYLTDQGTFDLTVESPNVKAGIVTALFLSSGSPDDPGTVRGNIRYQGSLSSPKGRRLSGELEFSGAQLALLRDPFHDVAGRVLLNGNDISFDALKGRLAGTGFDFSGQWRSEGDPQLVFSLHLAESDLGAILALIDEETHEWYDRLRASGRVTIQKGRYEGFQFSDFESDLILEKRRWQLENVSARSAGGTIRGKGSFLDQPKGLSFSVEPKIDGVPVESLLRWFDFGTAEVTGKIHLTGNLQSAGTTALERKRNLNGALRLEIQDGTVRRFRLLVLLLNFLDLSRWFTLQMPDVYQEGIRFHSITGDFKISQGVYSTQNLLVDSDDLKITGAGKVDGPEGKIDFVIATRPFPRLDTAVNFLPLIGPGIAAIKNSLLVASFRVTGAIDNPAIVPAPLSTLSEFFFSALSIPKSLLGLPAEQK